MTSHHPSELDSNAGDSVASSPRSDYSDYHHHQHCVRFMCSFGGQILPRPHDNQLRYVSGETRIVAIHRSTTFSALLTKLSKLSSTTSSDISVKYQLPNEDLDALISVTSDEDVENMMEEYDRLAHGQNPKTSRLRLRLFLFPVGTSCSSASNLGSLLGGSNRRENWFFDALNGGSAGSAGSASLERGRSEVSSIVSEVPDYLFGLDNSDDTRESLKLKNRPVLADLDPGSPAPAINSSPYCSTSSAPCIPSSMPDLPPVKTKPEQTIPVVVDVKENHQVHGLGDHTGEPLVQQQSGYPGNPVWHYMPESHFPGQTAQPMPVYYVTGHVPGGNIQVQTVPMPATYVPRYQVPSVGQVPVGYCNQVPGVGQFYGGGMKPVTGVEGYEFPAGGVADGVSHQQVYYGARNAGVMQPGYHTPVVPMGTDLQGSGVETRFGKVSQSQ